MIYLNKRQIIGETIDKIFETDTFFFDNIQLKFKSTIR